MSAVVQAITSFAPISRASIAKKTGLSKQTVGEIVSSLEHDGWVRVIGQTEGKVGRRAVVYEIVPDAALIASVDLGGTKVRVALCDMTGCVVCEVVEPTVQTGGEAVVAQIARLIGEAAAARKIAGKTIRVAVVGVPGVPDPATGAVKFAPNIAGIESVNFPAALSARLGIEVLVENDVNLAALGEHWMAHQDKTDNLVFLSIGTGIGAGIIVGGNLLRGATGAAGEIAYLPFGADPFEPESRKQGALERVAATSAIRNNYRALTGRDRSVPEIFEGMLSGDEAARQALSETASKIALGIGAIAAVIDPACVVIGGSIGSRREMIDMIRTALEKCFPRPVLIEASVLGNRAALAGGAAIALSHLHLSLFSADLRGPAITVRPPDLDAYRDITETVS
jgi:predicted NBD/HSP70 family sugar kinase